jgi:hypothetical protein
MGCIRETVDGLLADCDAVAEAIIRLGLKCEKLYAETRKRLNRPDEDEYQPVVHAA